MRNLMNIKDCKIQKVYLGQNGNLAIRYKNGKVRNGLKPRRLFPLTNKYEYISLIDQNDEEVGIIRDLRSLDNDSRNSIQMSLDRYYVLPRILKIVRIEEKYGVGNWLVITDKGEKSFEVLNYSVNIKRLGRGHLVIVDSDDNRYEIPDYRRLDKTSVRLIEERL